MIETIKWEATKRKPMTKGELNEAKKSGLLPAVINFRGKESISIMVNRMDLVKRPYGNFRIELKVKGTKEPYDCYLKEIQYDHNHELIHADFQGLTVGQEIDIDVAIELIGEPAGLKMAGILNTGYTSVRIRTLPKNMPNSIQVDISDLNIGDSINITDIEFSEFHTLLEPLEGTVASVLAPRMEEEEDTETSDEMPEPEIITERSED